MNAVRLPAAEAARPVASQSALGECVSRTVRRYLADASYWIYLAHLPLVMALQVAMSRVQWPWFVEFALTLAVAMALLLISYDLFVRNGFIGAWLNGRRKPRGLEHR